MTTRLTALVAILALGNAAAVAQDRTWQPMLTQGIAGADGRVRSVCSWDPDGAGPLQPVTVIAGDFSTVGMSEAFRVGLWDGAHWSGLGSGSAQGLSGIATGIRTFRGDLIAELADGPSTIHALNKAMRWDGAAWVGIDQNLTRPIHLLREHGDLLFASASVPALANSTAYLYTWDGAAWQQAPGAAFDGPVLDAVEFEGDLIVVGSFHTPFNFIARWNGSAWLPVGTALTGTSVNSAAVYEGHLYIGGKFAAPTVEWGNHLVRLDGSRWHALGSGFGNSAAYSEGIGSIAPSAGSLYVMGDFSDLGGVTCSGLARWDGAAWHALAPASYIWGIYSVAETNGQVFALGDNIGNYDDTRGWSAMGPGLDGYIRNLARDGDQLVALGYFYRIDGVAAKNIAVFGSAGWAPLGAGIGGTLNALAAYHGLIIVGGANLTSGTQSLGSLAAWDGRVWRSLGINVQTGPHSVNALLLYGDDLIVGGRFTAPTGGICSVAAWNGATWRNLSGPAATDYQVNAMAVFQQDLIVGGFFASIGGVTASGIARWDGSAWHAVDPSLPNIALSGIARMAVSQGILYVSGWFLGPVYTSTNLYKRGDTGWQSIASGIASSLPDLLTSYQNLLLAGETPDPRGPETGLWSWNNDAWAPMQPGLNQSVLAALEWNDDLYAAGAFTRSGQSIVLKLARLAPPGAGPTILDAFGPASACNTATATFRAVARGGPGLTYRWFRDGAALTDGQTAWGSVVSGAGTSVLALINTWTADTGMYQCRVTDSFGQSFSPALPFSVCIGDADCDGGTTGADVEVFFSLWQTGDQSADLSRDGGVDGGDVEAFFVAWEAGC